MLVELPMKPMGDVPLMVRPRTDLPVFRWRAATLEELGMAGMVLIVGDETGHRPYARDQSGRRWLLDGSGDVA